jgi:hypothetical protein
VPPCRGPRGALGASFVDLGAPRARDHRHATRNRIASKRNGHSIAHIAF